MTKLASLLYLVCLQVQAITISTINTEWFLDYKDFHEGQVVGYEYDDICLLSRNEYRVEAFSLVKVTKVLGSDFIGPS